MHTKETKKCPRCGKNTYLKILNKVELCSNCVTEYDIEYEGNIDNNIFNQWLGSYKAPQPITDDEIRNCSIEFQIPPLSEIDNQQLTEALQKIYPAHTATCDLRSSYQYEKDTNEIELSVWCIVSKCIQSTIADNNELINKLLEHSTPEKVYVLKTEYLKYIEQALPPHKLSQVYISDLPNGECMLNVRISAVKKH